MDKKTQKIIEMKIIKIQKQMTDKHNAILKRKDRVQKQKSRATSEFQAQGLLDWAMGSGITHNLDEKVTNELESVRGVITGLSEAFNSATNSGDKVASLIQETNSIASSVVQKVPIIIGFFTILILYLRSEEKSVSRNLKYLSAAVALCSLYFSKEIVSRIDELVELVKDIRQHRRTKGSDFVIESTNDIDMAFEIQDMRAQAGGDFGTVIQNLSATCSSILILFMTKTSPAKDKLKNIMHGCSSFPRMRDGISEILAWLTDLIKRTINYVSENMLGKTFFESIHSVEPKFNKWCDRILNIKSMKRENVLHINTINHDILYNLLMEGHKMQLSHSKIFENVTVRMTHANFMHTLKGLLTPFEQANIRGTGPRMEPLTLMLKGASGVGKSYLTTPFILDMISRVLQDEYKDDFRANPMDFIYCRNPEHKFWDGYRGQFATLFDDFGQARDYLGRDESEYMDIIRGSNMFPYVLHMASLEDKGNTMFNSKIIVATSNLMRSANVHSIVQPEALTRRFELNVVVVPARKFCTKETQDLELDQRRFDKNSPLLNQKKLNMDVYEFHMQDNEDRYNGLVYSYEEFMLICVEKFNAKMGIAQSYLENLNSSNFPLNSVDTDDLDMEECDSDDDSDDEEITHLKEIMQPISHYVAQGPNGEQILERKNKYEYSDLLVHVTNTLKVKLDNSVIRYKDKSLCDLVLHLDELFFVELFKYNFHSDFYTAMQWFVDNFISKLCEIYVSGRSPSNFLVLDEIPALIHIVKTNLILETQFDSLTNKLVESLELDKKEWTPLKQYVAQVNAQKYKFVRKIDRQLLKAYDKTKKFFSKAKNSYQDKLREYPIFTIFSTVVVPLLIGAGLIVTFKYSRSSTDEETPATELITNLQLPIDEADDRDKEFEKKMYEAQFSSGENSRGKAKPQIVAVKREKILKVAKQTQLVPQNSDDLNTQQIVTIIINNSIYEIISPTGTRIGSVLFVKGRFFIINHHYIDFIKRKMYQYGAYDLTFVNKLADKKFLVPGHFFTNRENYCELEDRDVAMYEAPKIIPMHKDLVKHFITDTQKDKITQIKAKVFGLYGITIPISSVMAFALTDVKYKDVERPDAKMIKLQKGYKYQGYGDAGACGAVLCIDNASVGPGKILGIHSAGIEGNGLASCVTRQDLTSAMELFKESEIDMSKMTPQSLEENSFTREEFITNTLKSKFEVIGKIDQSITTPVQTTIVKSPLYAKWGSAKTRPTDVRYFKNKETELYEDCRLAAVYQYNNANVNLDYNKVDLIYYNIFATLFNDSSIPHLDQKKVFSFDQAVLGIPELKISAISRTTSPGYPWVNLRPTSSKGKTYWFGSEVDYNLSQSKQLDALRLRVKNINDCAKEGLRCVHYFIDTAKDERRKIAKVEAGQIRMFSAAPMDYVIAFRMYFLGFFSWLTDNRIINRMGVGINPYSREWNFLAESMLRYGDNCIAGDYKQFDKSQDARCLKMMVKFINLWYNDGNDKIRETLWTDVYSSNHIFEMVTYTWNGSLPSGHPATVFINCLYNWLILEYVFCETHPNGFNQGMSDFANNVYFSVYGDDNILSVKDLVTPWFNQQTLSIGILKYFGLIYTNEQKNNLMVEKFRSILQISYLKRSFSYDAQFGYVAPLELDPILEMAYWTRKGIEYHTITIDNVEACLRELSLHDEEIFAYWGKKIIEASKNTIKYSPKVSDYMWLREQVLSTDARW